MSSEELVLRKRNLDAFNGTMQTSIELFKQQKTAVEDYANVLETRFEPMQRKTTEAVRQFYAMQMEFSAEAKKLTDFTITGLPTEQLMQSTAHASAICKIMPIGCNQAAFMETIIQAYSAPVKLAIATAAAAMPPVPAAVMPAAAMPAVGPRFAEADTGPMGEAGPPEEQQYALGYIYTSLMHQPRLQWSDFKEMSNFVAREFKAKHGRAATWIGNSHLYSHSHLADVADWIEHWSNQPASARPCANPYSFGRMP